MFKYFRVHGSMVYGVSSPKFNDFLLPKYTLEATEDKFEWGVKQNFVVTTSPQYLFVLLYNK